MAWAEPEFDKSQINAAAKLISIGGSEYFFNEEDYMLNIEAYLRHTKAIDIVNNWRSSHGYPLNTFQINLRTAARRFDSGSLVAQRTKRLASITAKLQRHQSMKLTQMQDIGGCRAVVTNIGDVQNLGQYYLEKSAIKHELASFDDYIKSPQKSGYRGLHLVYRYFSDTPSKAIYNGLKIEMQLRSQRQHAWATAVETVGTFVREALKSSAGSEDWLRFFALMSSAIALTESASIVPGTPEDTRELFREISDLTSRLNVVNRLKAYGAALKRIEGDTRHAHYYLLQLDPDESQLKITGFRQNSLDVAQLKYAEAEIEAKKKGLDAVLVSVSSVAALPKAYPNYFADTTVFLNILSGITASHRRSIMRAQGRT